MSGITFNDFHSQNSIVVLFWNWEYQFRIMWWDIKINILAKGNQYQKKILSWIYMLSELKSNSNSEVQYQNQHLARLWANPIPNCNSQVPISEKDFFMATQAQ